MAGKEDGRAKKRKGEDRERKRGGSARERKGRGERRGEGRARGKDESERNSCSDKRFSKAVGKFISFSSCPYFNIMIV